MREQGEITMAAATMARAIPVFPDVGSTSTVSPGVMSPRFWASLIIEKPMRSLTELQGSMLYTADSGMAEREEHTVPHRTGWRPR